MKKFLYKNSKQRNFFKNNFVRSQPKKKASLTNYSNSKYDMSQYPTELVFFLKKLILDSKFLYYCTYRSRKFIFLISRENLH